MASATDSMKRDSQGRLVVPFYSRFFSSLSENVMCSNAMYNELKEEIEASVCIIPASERVVLTVYESSPFSDDSTRESVLIGFRKYIARYSEMKNSMLRRSFITFLLLALFGVLTEFLNYNVFLNALAEWVCNLIDVSATVLIWQFVAYLAFEFSQERKYIRRLKQIMQAEYAFRHWE